MGCVGSKQTVLVTPAIENSVGSASCRRRRIGPEKSKSSESRASRTELGTGGSDSVSFRLGNLHKYVEGEQVAAGWPAWLCAVAGDAIHGWVPLPAESFEKLEKIGQGTYSSVFRARDVETGNIVALKKVRFDNFEPESVRFMAREILILRRLDHPNIIKLEGIITSRISCSIYLVFEYMEHDLTGLVACPDIKFSESQVKCYMKQLLSGVEHCHSRGVMHRDIKGSNLLINNEGILKIADFGLANFCSPENGHPLTSRVVTLWYRPPELLLGSTEYGSSVDLWSIGCVFAEILLGKPILQGRTEVEQLHKIFKLCGSPPDEYWKKSRLPHATLFKPQHTYESRLLESCRGFPDNAVKLLATFLSVEPHRRETASAALASEYFKLKPYACDPSSLPKYPPNKEIDAKSREDAKRKKFRGKNRGTEATRVTKNSNRTNKLAPVEDLPPRPFGTHHVNGNQNQVCNDVMHDHRNDRPAKLLESFHLKDTMDGEVPFSGPLQLSSSSGFSWASRRNDDTFSRTAWRGRINLLEESNGTVRRPTRRPGADLERPDSFDSCEASHSQEMAWTLYRGEGVMARKTLVHQSEEEKVEFSGPLLTQTHKVDQLLERHERHIRQVVRRSWFRRGKKPGK